ncbi:protein of unknown function [Taphrina deformans PYCC 5710]|uniref:Uncharacterized protein n=1 Tax=Taphrina deformans (strain PYCC 5710 / ATCC 11124 / CBS 356.35 / IMI 108563 / JCM 9778 / NBRC 8474) TaxID=1097556 RepID=R4XCG9_TAPDE|nr:protein of unknown function [Taphrina deformans PYCC 5710]|eukprot:CCG83291.1 protein of unknown function [Taphrina deformans PYCC 5710]
MDRAIGARALKRLLLGFLLCFVTLSVLYSARDRISSVGYSDLVIGAPRTDNVTASEIGLEPIDVDTPDQLDLLKTVNAKTCAERRKHYKALVDATTGSRKLNLDGANNLVDLPFTLCKSQPLSTETCWRAGERLAPLKHEIDDALNRCNALEQPRNRTALVLRLEIDNLFTDDAILNLRALLLEVGWYFGIDVNILQIRGEEYDDEKVPVEFRRLLVNYRADTVFDGFPEDTHAKDKINRPGLNYNLDVGSRYATTFYQFPQTWWFDQKEEYSFAYFIDSHVRHTGSYNHLFKSITQMIPRNADLVTMDPVQVTKPSVLWGAGEAARPESYYRGRFMLHGISRKLSAMMKDSLMAGLNAPHDGFLPAVAVKNEAVIVMFAHPVMKRKDGMLFPTYTLPDEKSWPIHNLHASDSIIGDRQVWQHGGTYAVDATRYVQDSKTHSWVDDMYQAWIAEPRQCLPGLLLYPVSGR